MIDISKFLLKFSKIRADNLESNSKIISAVKIVSGLDVPLDSFYLNNGILRFNLSPVMKSEIFMYKNKILSELHAGGSLVKDIR